MADDNNQPDPFTNLMAMLGQQQQSGNAPMAPTPAPVPPVPDVSGLPVNSGPVPQAPPVPQQQPQQPSVGTPRPILMELIQGLVKPRQLPGQIDSTGAQGPPTYTSRTEAFESFLGNFVTALGQGLQAAHGPGAAAKGFGAAVGAPLQLQMQQQQLQSELAQRQSQTQLTQQQAAGLPAEQAARIASLTAQARTDPTTGQFIGMMTDPAYANYLKGQGAASVTARSKEAISQFNALAAQGRIAKVLPAQGGGYIGYDNKGNPVKVYEGAIDPAMLQKQSTTVDWKDDGAGGFVALPKTTVSGPVQSQLAAKVPALGASQAQPAPSGFPKATGSATNKPGGGTVYGNAPIFALDPTTNERVLTTPGEAAQKGWTNPVKVKEGDIDKYRTATVQFNDVQSNLSRYTKAARDYSDPRAPLTRNGVAVSPQNPVEVSSMGSFVGMPSHITNSDDMRAKDNDNFQTLLNKAGWADMQASISAGGHITVPMLTAMGEKLSRSVNSKAYNELSDQGKALMDGYIRTLSSVPAYQKALTGLGRLNKETMELEMANIPNPTMAPNDQLRKLAAWQENVDMGATGIPRLPGIPTVKETRARFEGTGGGGNAGFRIPTPF